MDIDLGTLDEEAFQRLYTGGIEPCFRENEAGRLAAVSAFKTRLFITAPLAVLAVAGAWLWLRSGGFALTVGAVAAIMAYGYAYAPLARVGQKLKQDYCSAIAQAMGATFQIAGFAPPALERVKKLRLLPSYDRSSFENLFSGKYRDARFDIYESHLEQKRTDSKGRTHYSTVFRGQIVRMQFPRKFLGVTIVRRDAGWFNGFGGGSGLERVGLEDPVFERAFEVWGSDQVEARYLLHPALMQRLLDLEVGLRGKKLRCAFEGGDLLVAIEGGNLFEPGDLFKPFDDPARARRIVDDIASVVRVMERVLTAQAARAPNTSS